MLTLAVECHSQRPLDVGLRGGTAVSFIHLVIIHDCVQGFDPQGVNIPVQDNPGWPIVPEICLLSQNGREEACKEGANVANTVEGCLSLKYI